MAVTLKTRTGSATKQTVTFYSFDGTPMTLTFRGLGGERLILRKNGNALPDAETMELASMASTIEATPVSLATFGGSFGQRTNRAARRVLH